MTLAHCGFVYNFWFTCKKGSVKANCIKPKKINIVFGPDQSKWTSGLSWCEYTLTLHIGFNASDAGKTLPGNVFANVQTWDQIRSGHLIVMPGMFRHRIRSCMHVCGIGPRQCLEHLGCASRTNAPGYTPLFFWDLQRQVSASWHEGDKKSCLHIRQPLCFQSRIQSRCPPALTVGFHGESSHGWRTSGLRKEARRPLNEMFRPRSASHPVISKIKPERQLKSRKLTRSWSESVSWPDPVCSNASCALTVRTGFTQEIHVALRCCVKYGNASYSAAAFCYAYKWYISSHFLYWNYHKTCKLRFSQRFSDENVDLSSDCPYLIEMQLRLSVTYP